MWVEYAALLTTGIPTITDCVLAELEKLGPKYRLALRYVRGGRSNVRIAKDPRFDRLKCDRESEFTVS